MDSYESYKVCHRVVAASVALVLLPWYPDRKFILVFLDRVTLWPCPVPLNFAPLPPG